MPRSSTIPAALPVSLVTHRIRTLPAPVADEDRAARDHARSELLSAAREALRSENADLSDPGHLSSYHGALQLAQAVVLYLELEIDKGL